MGGSPITKETSLQLALLKICACVGVVYIHGYMLHFNFFTITPEKLPVVYYVQTILSQYIARVALPVFFSVSGYIYFAKQYQDSTRQFMLRKAKGILWPYILWNSITLFYIFAAQLPEFTRGYFTEHLLIANFDTSRWLQAYFGLANGWFPFLYPLWFLPYLFAAFMIVHVMRKYLEKFQWLIWLFAAANLICYSYIPLYAKAVHWGPFLRILYAISFFTMGGLLLKYRSYINKKAVLLICGTLFTAATAVDITNLTPLVKWNTLAFYAGVIFMFSLTGNVGKCSEKTGNAIRFLAGFSFLIYLTHEFALTALTKLIYPGMPGKTLYILLPYLLIPPTLVSVLIAGGYILKKLLPKVYDFLFSTH